MSATLPIDGRVGFDSSGALLSRNQNGVFRWPVRVEAGSPERYHLGPPERVTSRRPASGCEFSMSRDGRVLAFAQGNHAIVVHRAPSQRTLTLGPQYDLRRVAVSPDGRWVVTGSHWADGSGEYAKLWAADTGKLVKVLSMGAGTYPNFSADGHWVYCPYGDSGSWYEVGSGKPKAVACPAGLLAPDGHLLACMSGFGELRLVHFETGKELARISIPDQTRLSPQSFSPDGAYLYAIGGENGRHYRWDLRLIRRQLAELGLDVDLPSYPEPAERTKAWPAPLDVTVHGAELASDPLKRRQHELVQAALAWGANPFDAEAHFRLGAIALMDGHSKEAYVHLSVARALRPEDFEVRRLRASAAIRVGHWAEAVTDSDSVLRKQPDHLHALRTRSQALQQLGRHADAVTDLTALLRFYPQDFNLYRERARCYDALRDRAHADADRKKAIETEPNDPETINARAWRLLTDPGEPRDPVLALELARKVIEMAPDSQLYLNTLGVAQYRNGLYTAAIGTLEKSLKTGKGKFDAFDLFFLAMCHARLGDSAKARDCFDRALKWMEGQKNLGPRDIEDLRAFRAEAEVELRSR